MKDRTDRVFNTLTILGFTIIVVVVIAMVISAPIILVIPAVFAITYGTLWTIEKVRNEETKKNL